MKKRTKSNATFNNFKWSKADHDLMIALLKEGKTFKQVAKCLGRSVKSIEQRVYITRKELRESGMSEKAIMDLIPTNPDTRSRRFHYRGKKRKPDYSRTPSNKASDVVEEMVATMPTIPARPNQKPIKKPTLKPIIESKEALVEREPSNLLIATIACAIGVWFIVGLLLASIL
jgi:hypothetical protein